jgi:hypothetical protein
MSRPISPRDLESLSAFLDNQLPTKERNQLQARLLAEPELKVTLDDLRRTRALLQQAPKARAPRSFALRPEQVAARSRSSLFNNLRWVSSVATVLLALVVAGDLWSGRLSPGAQSGIALMAPAAADSTAPTDTIGAAEMTGPADEAPAEESRIMEAEPTPDPAGATALQVPTEKMPEEEPLADEGIAPEVGPTEVNWQRWLRWAEIGLAVLAVSSGVAAWVARRRG